MQNNNKNAPWKRCVLLLVAIVIYTTAFSERSRFNFIKNKTSSTFQFKQVKNLIIIPVAINGESLNLILDTGMRSIVLFGKGFENKLELLEGREASLAGYGKKNQKGKLSLNNKIEIGDVLGRRISLLVVPDRSLFRKSGISKVDGLIGYEIFSRFAVKIDYKNKLLTLYEPFTEPDLDRYESLPLIIKDTKPYIKASFMFDKDTFKSGYYHVDTGSSLDLLLFIKKDEETSKVGIRTIIGYGIGGVIRGYRGDKGYLKLGKWMSRETDTRYVTREFSNREIINAVGSIGSGFLKNTVIVIDYVNSQFHYKV